jgi:hypothetical protein
MDRVNTLSGHIDRANLLINFTVTIITLTAKDASNTSASCAQSIRHDVAEPGSVAGTRGESGGILSLAALLFEFGPYRHLQLTHSRI